MQAGLRAHAARCYAAALSVYANRRWLHVEDHAHIFLARQAHALGRPLAAVGSFVAVLRETKHQQADRQARARARRVPRRRARPRAASPPAAI